MASRFTRSMCAGVLAATVSTGALGCAPSDEAGEGRSAGTTVAGIGVGTDPAARPGRLPPPRPAVISFVAPAMSGLSPAPAPARAAPVAPAAPPPVLQPVPAPEPARPDVPPGIIALSRHIDDVMSDLDRLVEESLQLQYSLLRLRLRPKQRPTAPVEPDPGRGSEATSPVDGR